MILLDGFGDQGMPDALCSEAFYADCLRALRDDGLLVINFHVNHPLYHEYLARVRESFGAAMFEVVDDDMTNSIVFACKGDLLDDPASAAAPARGAIQGCVASADADLARHRRDADAALDEPTVGRRGSWADGASAACRGRDPVGRDFGLFHFRIPWRSLEWPPAVARFAWRESARA